MAIFMARKGAKKEAIRERISKEFEDDLSRTVDGLRPNHKFEISYQRSVPESIICFLDADSFEEKISEYLSDEFIEILEMFRKTYIKS